MASLRPAPPREGHPMGRGVRFPGCVDRSSGVPFGVRCRNGWPVTGASVAVSAPGPAGAGAASSGTAGAGSTGAGGTGSPRGAGRDAWVGGYGTGATPRGVLSWGDCAGGMSNPPLPGDLDGSDATGAGCSGLIGAPSFASGSPTISMTPSEPLARIGALATPTIPSFSARWARTSAERARSLDAWRDSIRSTSSTLESRAFFRS